MSIAALRERGLVEPLAEPREQRSPVPRVLSDKLGHHALLDERDDGLLRLGGQLGHGAGLAVAHERVLADNPHEHVRRSRAHDIAEPERLPQPCVQWHGIDAGDPHWPGSGRRTACIQPARKRPINTTMAPQARARGAPVRCAWSASVIA
jgi:hypothetical protein